MKVQLKRLEAEKPWSSGQGRGLANIRSWVQSLCSGGNLRGPELTITLVNLYASVKSYYCLHKHLTPLLRNLSTCLL